MPLMYRERSVLERAVRTVCEQATAADRLVHEALDADLGDSHAVTLHAKMLRLELLNVKADLERKLGQVERGRTTFSGLAALA